MISQNAIFSDNEELREYHATSIKYLAVPYYLGELYQQVHAVAPNERLPQLKRAKEYLEMFLKQTMKLGILNKRDADAYRTDAVANAETKRNEKIRRYKREKEIQQQIQALMNDKIKKGIDEDTEDESELERKTSLLLLECKAIKAIDTLSTLKQEIEIVNHMAKLTEQNNGQLPPPPKPVPDQRPPAKPIVITDTKQFIKDNAFKPGWNLPTVSIEEAAEIDYQDMLRREVRQKESERKKSEKLVKEYGDDDDEAEELKKTRDFDSYKDDHPRGSGNTGTKGYKY